MSLAPQMLLADLRRGLACVGSELGLQPEFPNKK